MRSPLTGTVVERTGTPGQSVGGDPGQVLFTVADLDVLQVVADVYERDLGLVHGGQVATVTVEAYPGGNFPVRLPLSVMSWIRILEPSKSAPGSIMRSTS